MNHHNMLPVICPLIPRGNDFQTFHPTKLRKTKHVQVKFSWAHRGVQVSLRAHDSWDQTARK